MQKTFRLSQSFLNLFKNKIPDFGFNGLGEFVYLRTYSRLKEDGSNELWWETIQRVVEGTYSIQKRHILEQGLRWDDIQAQESAQEMYELMFDMKFLPPGRGLWAMGTSLIEEKGLGAPLNNCAFVSTENLDKEPTKPFEFLMDMSMLGVGVGFDIAGAGKAFVTDWQQRAAEQNFQLEETKFVIPDTREGWVQSIKLLIESYIAYVPKEGEPPVPEEQAGVAGFVTFDYSLIRPEGAPIKTFGGVASGPAPLIVLHDRIRKIFKGRSFSPITATDIVDIMNMIGCCVVAGNVRRTAEIALGPIDNNEYIQLKDYRWNNETYQYEGPQAQRAEWGWSSNNSVFASVGEDFSKIAAQIGQNGEPGVAFLENMQGYSRMNGAPDYKDHKATGLNPCAEQTLESFELCCLVETFPSRCANLEEFLRVLKCAYLYAKTVTLVKTHWPETNRVTLRNRRIGASQSGIVMAIAQLGIDQYRQWCEAGYQTIQNYDKVYSDWLCVPLSIKTTSIKPSGTISLLAGVTPGMHFPENNYYTRRVRVRKQSPLLKALAAKGYHIEDDVVDISSAVVEFPVAIEGVRTVDDVSVWEQVALAVFLQKHWADNQVSCTVTFSKQEASQIEHVLNYFQYGLKAISFLPKLESQGTYAQMPYESITKEAYEQAMLHIDRQTSIQMQGGEDSKPELYCDGDSCSVI